MNPSVTVAFIPRDSMSQTLEMLDTLLAHTQQPFDLIVVAGGYPAGLVKGLRERMSGVGGRLIEFAKYVTPNEARNAALEATKTDYIAFVDHDVYVDRNWLPPLLACARETGAAIVSPLIFEHEPLFSQLHMAGGEARIIARPEGGNIYHDVHHDAHAKLDGAAIKKERWVTELAELHAVLVEVAWLNSIGGFDSDLLSVSEHWDMSIAASQTGRDIYLEPESRVNHLPPKEPTRTDLRWFAVRWSEEWNERSIVHLCRKYGLVPEEGSFKGLRWFINFQRGHRFILARQRIMRYFGPSFGSVVFERIAKPILEQLEKPRVRRDLTAWEAQRNGSKLGNRFQQH